MLCSFCSKSEPVKIEISSLNLRICPNCFATFLPASQFSMLRNNLNDTTRAAWVRKLYSVINNQVANSESGTEQISCLDHGSPLAGGTIPGYSFNALVPNCCDLQHLPPSLMIKILELGLGISEGAGGMRSFMSVSKRKPNAIAGFLGSIIFSIFERKPKAEDGLSRLQYDSKFKNVLGEWIPE